MHILVTGAGGFIGSHVVRTLAAQGHTVFATVRKHKMTQSQNQPPADVHFLELNLGDCAALPAAVHECCPEVTIHLAWYTKPGEYWTAPVNLDCVSATLRMARVLAEAGCRKLVVAGTCAEYDWDSGFLSEECTPLKPRTLYGACKNALREMLEFYCRETSMQFAWARLFYLYGPGENRERFVPSIILPLLHGQTARCTNGEQVRDFLHVEDVAGAIAAVATGNFTGAVNIASGQPVKIRRIVETIARILDLPDRIVFGGIQETTPEVPLLVADVRRLARGVGWTPSHTLEQGLAETVDWWRSV